MSEEPTPAENQTPGTDGNTGNMPPPALLRARMVEKLQTEGVLRDAAVTRALATVPRHLFLPGQPITDAYADIAVPTHFEDGNPISSASQPAIVAIMLQQLQTFPGMRVLEIGAGTGYNAALLSELAGPQGAVTTVDIGDEIAAEARDHLRAASYREVEVIAADGGKGWPANAPYDRIELTVGASDITPAWAAQLRDGGLLVLPLWLGAMDASIAFRKQGAVFMSESLSPCGFMRLRGGEGDARKWVALSGGWRVAGEHAESLAPNIAKLLETRPRRRLWPRGTGWPPSFAQYLALGGRDVLILWPEVQRKGRARIRQRIGLYMEGADGPSLCVLAAMLPFLLCFGGTAAERVFFEEWARWQSSRVLPLEQWRITAYPRDIAPPQPPTGAARHSRRHYTLDIAYLALDG